MRQPFYREVELARTVWAIRDANGYPAPRGTDGERAMPFWSSEARASRLVEQAPAYRKFQPVAIDWLTFCERWVPGLAKDGLLAGLNWSGPNDTGFDVSAVEVQARVEACLRR